MKPVFGGAGLKGTVAERINAMRDRSGLEPIESVAPVYGNVLGDAETGDDDHAEQDPSIISAALDPGVQKKVFKIETTKGCSAPILDMPGFGFWSLVSPLAVNAQYAFLRMSTDRTSSENVKHQDCHGYSKAASLGQSVRDLMQKHPWSVPSILVGAGVGAYHGHQKKDGFKTTGGYAALGAAFPFLFLGYLAYDKFYGKGKS